MAILVLIYLFFNDYDHTKTAETNLVQPSDLHIDRGRRHGGFWRDMAFSVSGGRKRRRRLCAGVLPGHVSHRHSHDPGGKRHWPPPARQFGGFIWRPGARQKHTCRLENHWLPGPAGRIRHHGLLHGAGRLGHFLHRPSRQRRAGHFSAHYPGNREKFL